MTIPLDAGALEKAAKASFESREVYKEQKGSKPFKWDTISQSFKDPWLDLARAAIAAYLEAVEAKKEPANET